MRRFVLQAFCATVAVLALAGSAHAQATFPYDHVHVNVPDPAAASKWYETHFGGKRITEAVVEVRWQATSREAWLDDAWFDEFTLRGQLPPQRCRNCETVRLLGPAFSGAWAISAKLAGQCSAKACQRGEATPASKAMGRIG